MDNKEAYLEFLRNNPLYVSALKSVDVDQAKKISAVMESFATEVANAFVPFIEKLKSDPEFNKQFVEQLRKQKVSGNSVVIDDGPKADDET